MRARLERAKHYTTICNSAPSEILARIAIKARKQILSRTRSIIAANLPAFDAFFTDFEELFERRAPDGGCVAYPRYLGADGVEEFCTDLVEDPGHPRDPRHRARQPLRVKMSYAACGE